MDGSILFCFGVGIVVIAVCIAWNGLEQPGILPRPQISEGKDWTCSESAI